MGERRVEGGAGVPLGEQQPVTVRPVGTLGIDPQVVEVERGQDLGAGEGAAQVAAVAVVDHLQYVQPELLGAAVQLAHEPRGMVMGMPHAPEP